MPRVRVFVACSLDGFIAGPNDELDWLDPREGEQDTFGPFFEQIGAMLMGRRTYDVVDAFDGPWPYGDTPLLVATRRDLVTERPQVQAVAGAIGVLIAQAREAAGKADIYLDGGELIRQALTAGLVDQITVTVVPEILGAGIPLFSGMGGRHSLNLAGCREVGGGLVELVYEPRRSAGG